MLKDSAGAQKNLSACHLDKQLSHFPVLHEVYDLVGK